MVAVGYIRVSTENQNGSDTYGLDTQRSSIAKYCQDNEFELVQIFEDPALSGSLDALDRPGLRALLEAVLDGDKVVVTRPDRIARELYLGLWIEKEIRKAGAELISISEPYRWNDPTQKLLLNIIMSFAEFERSLITSRLSSGRKTKARQVDMQAEKQPLDTKRLEVPRHWSWTNIKRPQQDGFLGLERSCRVHHCKRLWIF